MFTYKAAVVILVILLMVLRVRTIGWLLIFYGFFFLVIAGVHLWVNFALLNKETDTFTGADWATFIVSNILYTAFFLVQMDFGDTNDSGHVAIQYIIGAGKVSEHIQNYFYLYFGGLLLPMIINYIFMYQRS